MLVIKVSLDSKAVFASDQLRSVIDIFQEGIIIYNRGVTHIIIDDNDDLRNYVLSKNVKKQRNFKELEDVLNVYERLIVCYNETGDVRVLPESIDFTSAFQHVKKLTDSYKCTHCVSLKQLEMERKSKVSSATTHRVVSLQKAQVSCQKVTVPVDAFYLEPCRNITDYQQTVVCHPTDDTPSQQREQFITAQGRQPDSNSELGQRDELIDNVAIANPQQDSANQSVLTYDYNRSNLSSYNIVTSQTPPSITSDFPRAQRNNPLPVVRPRYPDYVSFDDRFISYSNLWLHVSPSPRQLANAGFFFKHDGDLVRCFQCGIGLKDFSEGDDPLLEHVRHSMQCPYLRQLLGLERLNYIQTQLQASDPEFHRQLQWNAGQARFPSTRYRHPEYQTLEARLATYRGWPTEASQTPEQLAEAGLYYTGVEDHVRCFACDGGLRRWDPEDDPWTEHCRWFPGCAFCIEQKGEEYIALVQASVDRQDETGASRDELENQMQRLALEKAKTEIQMFYDTNKSILTDMGFKEADVKEALQELRNRGSPQPGIEEVVDIIQIIKERKEAEKASKAVRTDNPLEENQRLKELLVCNQCRRNSVNVLFLPCTHHKLCMECASPLSDCTICGRAIREKIRTFLV